MVNKIDHNLLCYEKCKMYVFFSYGNNIVLKSIVKRITFIFISHLRRNFANLFIVITFNTNPILH